MTLLYVLLLSLILPYLYSSSVSTSLLEHVLYSEDLMSAMYSPYFCCKSGVANWFILEWYILSQNNRLLTLYSKKTNIFEGSQPDHDIDSIFQQFLPHSTYIVVNTHLYSLCFTILFLSLLLTCPQVFIEYCNLSYFLRS